MPDDQHIRFEAVTAEIARMAVQPGDVVIVRIAAKEYSNQVAANLHEWMRGDLPDNRVWVLPDSVDISVVASEATDRIAIPCTCLAYPAPHAADCAITMTLPQPVECACGDRSGVPHRHPNWADSAPRILSAQQAPDGRRSEIREDDGD